MSVRQQLCARECKKGEACLVYLLCVASPHIIVATGLTPAVIIFVLRCA